MLEVNIKEEVSEKNVDLVRGKLIKSNQFNNIENRERGKLSNVKRFMLHVKVMKYKNFKAFDELKWVQDRDGDDILSVVGFDGSREEFHFIALDDVENHRVKNEYVQLKFQKSSDDSIEHKFIFRDPGITFKTECEQRFNDWTIDFGESESETEWVDDGEPQASTSAAAVSIFWRLNGVCKRKYDFNDLCLFRLQKTDDFILIKKWQPKVGGVILNTHLIYFGWWRRNHHFHWK